MSACVCFNTRPLQIKSAFTSNLCLWVRASSRPDWTIWLNYGACRLCLRSLGSMMNTGRCSSALLSAPGATPAPSPKPPCLSLVPLVHVLNEVFSKHQALSLPPHHPNETAPLISSPGHHSPQQTLRGGDNKTIIFSSMHWLIFCRSCWIMHWLRGFC